MPRYSTTFTPKSKAEELDPYLAAKVRYGKDLAFCGHAQVIAGVIVVCVCFTLLIVGLFLIYTSPDEPEAGPIGFHCKATDEFDSATVVSVLLPPSTSTPAPATEVELSSFWHQVDLASSFRGANTSVVRAVPTRYEAPVPPPPYISPVRMPILEVPRIPVIEKTRIPTRRPYVARTTNEPAATAAKTMKASEKPIHDDSTASRMPFVDDRRYGYIATDEEAKDCEAHRRNGYWISGVYRINLPTFGEFYALCLMEDPEHAWTVLQRRTSGREVFWNRTFVDYAYGFGNAASDQWLGLEKLYAYVVEHGGRMLQMRIELRGDLCEGTHCSGLRENGLWWGDWNFKIAGAEDKYRLNISTVLRGNLSTPQHDNLFSMNNGQRFSTVDELNNGRTQPQCARHRRWGAWWHRECTLTALNGEYGSRSSTPRGQFWMYRRGGVGPLHSYYIKPMQSLILFRVLQDSTA
ncbi:Fibrinogen [Aphelenchoides avenae]|nr:Fibrinogen [Aphelenchus avenae]